MRVIIRADATMSGGAGHVMRCWALAEEFTSREHNVSWLGKVDIPWLAAALAREGWQVISPNGEEQSQVQQLIDMSTDIVVVDSYWISNRFYEEAMSAGITVVTVTDDARDHLMPGNILVNPGVTLGLTPCDPAAQFLDGPDYIFIRQEIRKFRKQRLESLERKNLDIIRRPLRITVMLGGTDAAGLAPTLARQLAELAPTAELTVGPATPTSGPGQAEKSSGSSEADVTWLPAGPDLLRAAAASDLVISAAGVSSWELLYLGVPLALVQVVENQTGNYHHHTGSGWAWPLGQAEDFSDPQVARDRLEDLLLRVNSGSWVGKSRIDGLGGQRTVEAAIKLAS